MGTGAKAAAAPTRERQIAAVFIVEDGEVHKQVYCGCRRLIKQDTHSKTDNLVEEKSQKI